VGDTLDADRRRVDDAEVARIRADLTQTVLHGAHTLARARTQHVVCPADGPSGSSASAARNRVACAPRRRRHADPVDLPGKDDEFLCQADANGAHVEAQDPRICGALVDTHVQLLRIYEIPESSCVDALAHRTPCRPRLRIDCGNIYVVAAAKRQAYIVCWRPIELLRSYMKLNSPTREDLKDLRSRYHLTQTEAAALALSSLRTWQYWERGEHVMHPAIWRYAKIAARACAPRVAEAKAQTLPTCP
jgi:hypothetical protein